MNENPKIPDTWGIPDDQANKVREALGKKSIRPEDRVQDELEDMARDIALFEQNPVGWNGWAICLGEPKVDARFAKEQSERLIGDKA